MARLGARTYGVSSNSSAWGAVLQGGQGVQTCGLSLQTVAVAVLCLHTVVAVVLLPELQHCLPLVAQHRELGCHNVCE
jgi:hypothetical protein